MLTRKEFDDKISKIPGVKDDGHGNWVGIRLLTPTEKEERKRNHQKEASKMVVTCYYCGKMDEIPPKDIKRLEEITKGKYLAICKECRRQLRVPNN